MITVLDPVTVGVPAAIGGIIPDGIQRNYKSAGVNNPTGAPITLIVHLVAKNKVADTSNIIIDRAVPAGKTDMCPELIGRGLNAGGSLWVEGNGLTAGYTAIDTVA